MAFWSCVSDTYTSWPEALVQPQELDAAAAFGVDAGVAWLEALPAWLEAVPAWLEAVVPFQLLHTFAVFFLSSCFTSVIPSSDFVSIAFSTSCVGGSTTCGGWITCPFF